MNVLFVMPYPPFPPIFGGALREYHILNSIIKRHDVTILTYGNKDTSRELRNHFNSKVKDIHVLPYPWTRTFRRVGQLYAQCTSRSYFQLHMHSGKLKRKINELLSNKSFDVIHFEFSAMSDYDTSQGILSVMDAHNVEYENFQRMSAKYDSNIRKRFYDREYKKVRNEELMNISRQDALMVTSSRDKDIFDKDVPNVPKFVLPNGVDTSFFVPSAQPPEQHSIVFSGMMGYVPNDDAMNYFLDKIFPLIQKKVPDIKIYIVGNRPSKRLRRRASDNVIVTGFVEDVRPYIWRANVYVVPLRMGSGTRLKVVEALSMKKPVVSTRIGCEGIDVKDGESIMIRDDPSEFADTVVQLLHDRVTCDTLAENGYEIVHRKYDWAVIGDKVCRVYESLNRPTEKGLIRPISRQQTMTRG